MRKNDDGVMGESEVCGMVGRSFWTVRRWVKLGHFPAPVQLYPNAKRQWRRAVIRAWIDKQSRRRTKPTPHPGTGNLRRGAA